MNRRTMMKRMITPIMLLTASTFLVTGCDIDDLGGAEEIETSYEVRMAGNTTILLDLRTGSFYPKPKDNLEAVGGTQVNTSEYDKKYTITSQPTHGELFLVGTIVEYTPIEGYVGTDSAVVVAEDEWEKITGTINYTITKEVIPNGAPTIIGTPPSSVGLGADYSFIPTATDPNGDVLVFSIQGKPDWATFDEATGALTGVVPNTPTTVSGIIISCSDGEFTTSLPEFEITTSDDNHAPQIQGKPTTQILEGDTYSFSPTASDADGDELVFSIASKPHWANFDESTGKLSGVVELNPSTVKGVIISVSDGAKVSSLPSFDIEVVPK